jgi:hypothetical protein
MVGIDDASIDTSSLSSQRSMISDEAVCCGALGRAVVSGMWKKEESFDCPPFSLFGFDAPVVELSARGRLWGSWDVLGCFRRVWLEEGDTKG